MKNGKLPTRNQKNIMKSHGLDPEKVSGSKKYPRDDGSDRKIRPEETGNVWH